MHNRRSEESEADECDSLKLQYRTKTYAIHSIHRPATIYEWIFGIQQNKNKKNVNKVYGQR